MTRQKRLTALGVSLACIAAGMALLISQSVAQPGRPELWKQIAEADRKGLPRTGIKAAEQIYESAMKDKNYPEAIKAIGGKVEDRDALLAALRRVEIKDAPRGPIAVDQWNNPVQTIYVRKVEKVGGKLQNTVVATFPAVGQFYKYNPDEYMKAPLYSRDYPPCKHC